MKKEHLTLKSILYLIGGIIVLFLSLMAPSYLLEKFKPELFDALISANPSATSVALFFITLVLVVITGLLILFINKNQERFPLKLVGIIGIVIVAAVPALGVITVDSSFDTIGLLYFIVLMVAVSFWAGFALVKGFIHKLQRSK